MATVETISHGSAIPTIFITSRCIENIIGAQRRQARRFERMMPGFHASYRAKINSKRKGARRAAAIATLSPKPDGLQSADTVEKVGWWLGPANFVEIANTRIDNISDLAWRPKRRIRPRSSEFALTGLFQQYRP